MIDKEKAENFMDKTVDALNDAGEKMSQFVKDHELDKKAEAAAHTLEKGATEVWDGIKSSFSKDNKNNEKND